MLRRASLKLVGWGNVFYQDDMPLEVRPKFPCLLHDVQCQFSDLLVAHFRIFEHFAYEIHKFLLFVRLLDLK